ncbi:hypothetical protein ACFV6F_08990 [Kitasatospora phosalacinea]|uniref:hypothetical protein n=1 Tax=Kitasatospora phosalacinea TaxID=2065 RepID=UPI00365AA11B
MTTPDGRDPHTPRYTHYRFGQSPEPAPEPPAVLAIPHPAPLTPRGILITCPACGAERDWLLIQVGPQVFVRCRCTMEWLEHNLDAEEADQARQPGPETEWASMEEMYRGLGFDGILAHAYFG